MQIIQKFKNFIAKSNRALGLMVYSYMMDRGVAQDWRTIDYLKLYGYSDYASAIIHGIVKETAFAIAQTEVKFYRKVKGTQRKKLKRNHPLVDLFWNINPAMSRFDFWEATIIYLQLAGEAPWSLEKTNRLGQPKEMWILRPDYLKVVPDSKEFIKGYIYETGMGSVGYLPSEILFHKYFNPIDIWRGQSPFAGARQELTAEYYRTKYNINFFKLGASPSGVFTTDQTLNDDAYKRLQKELEIAYTGTDMAHRPMLLENGLKWQQMGANPKDSEFNQQHALNNSAIAGVLNVPTSFAFGGDTAFRYGNRDAGREQTKMFWGITIKPIIRKLEENINTFLVRRYGNDLFMEFDLSGIEAINDTNLEKSLVSTRCVEMGIMTPNEVRKTFWNLEPSLDEGADKRYMPNNLIEAGAEPPEKPKEDEKDDSDGNGKLLGDYSYDRNLIV